MKSENKCSIIKNYIWTNYDIDTCVEFSEVNEEETYSSYVIKLPIDYLPFKSLLYLDLTSQDFIDYGIEFVFIKSVKANGLKDNTESKKVFYYE